MYNLVQKLLWDGYAHYSHVRLTLKTYLPKKAPTTEYETLICISCK